MAKRCEICGKGPMFGHQISHAHNVSRRVFYPNVHRIRVIESGAVVRKKVCTKCMKAGKVQKA
ncbi:ribosomal protein L28 [Denitrovibrio acetiphilus DSM 12809]|uniref:Large ribosomal subunit protein bL28 n=1 Tax=Denitrovibrio acetiphilus (strain DSM 12809 / NBRC 114555 / N2460) TaxID=522772 RepID=D4H400_DENA2|nr:50S ribosomal protein L28 [Denitrovibrio acetiphilus]ADD67311.1 ribosomal protein L28 [Denitrovibrio acetiphilus DSM 12809]